MAPNYNKLKTNLRLSINRLKLLEKKKTELALKARREIADYISAGKDDRARIRVEHIIREDYLVEAMEIIEMYCDLLLARMGLIQQMKAIDEGLMQPICSVLWVCPRLQADVGELRVVADQFTAKYGKEFVKAAQADDLRSVNEKLKHKLSVQAPPKVLVEKYMIEIARSCNVPFTPDEDALKEDEVYAAEAALIDLGGGPGGEENRRSPPGGGGGGGFCLPQVPSSMPGASSGPPAPAAQPFSYPPQHPPTTGQYSPAPQQGYPGYSPQQGYPGQQGYPAGHSGYPGGLPPGGNPIFPPGMGDSEKPPLQPPAAPSRPPTVSQPTAPNQTYVEPPSYNTATGGGGAGGLPDLNLPDLPAVPSSNFPHSGADSPQDGPPGGGQDDIDFDDLTKRFEQLKKRK